MDITFEASTLTASEPDRLITGMLVPYGVQGRTNLGAFEVPRGSLELPADPAQMSTNIEHQREGVFGGGVSISDTPKGVVFAARAAKTPEGDQALADVASGKRTHWSVEAAGLVIEKGKAVAGRIFGAALVQKPAFPGASILLASLAEDEEGNAEAVTTDEDAPADSSDEATETVETYVDEFVDEDGNVSRRKTTTTTVTEGNTTTVTTVTETVEPDPETPNEADPETPEEEPIVDTLTASARRGATRPGMRPSQRFTATPRAAKATLGTLYAAISDARMTPTADAMDTLMAALTELKTTGSLGPAGGGGSNKGLPDNWVGALWNGRDYDRRFIHLGTLGTDITATGKRGFVAKRGTKAVPKRRNDGNWTGNLTEITSANAYIEETASSMHKFALANTIAREFFDLTGGAEFIEAYFKLLVEDYAIWSDEKALSIMLDTAGEPLAPVDHLVDTPADHKYPPAMVALIQGIRTINRRRDTPTFAVVNPAAYDELQYTPKDLIPEYVTFTVTPEGEGSADNGKVVVVEAADEDADLFVGTDGEPVVDDSKPAVLVGAQRAIEFDELGSTPLTIDALEIAKGGLDRAVHGYLQQHVVRARSLALIGTAVAAG